MATHLTLRSDINIPHFPDSDSYLLPGAILGTAHYEHGAWHCALWGVGCRVEEQRTFQTLREAHEYLASDRRFACHLEWARPVPVPIPETSGDYWAGTVVECACGGVIEVWAEAGYVPGSRACRRCLALYQLRGDGAGRRLVPQTSGPDGVMTDAGVDDDPYRVAADLYPGWAEL